MRIGLLDCLSPSPVCCADRLSPVPGERMGAKLDAHPLPSRSGGEVSSAARRRGGGSIRSTLRKDKAKIDAVHILSQPTVKSGQNGFTDRCSVFQNVVAPEAE